MVRSIKDIQLNGKKVFIRVDFNVPMKDGVVSDDTRIREAIKSIKFSSDCGAKVVLASHLGRPKGEKNLEFSLKPVADYINSKGLFKVKFVPDCIGSEVAKAIDEMKDGEILLLENLRFYKGEEKNDPEFVSELAKFYDVYVNDAFGTAHREHASTYGMAKIVKEKAAGFLLEKEAKYFDELIMNPRHPFASIIGGAKVSDKIGVINSLLNVVDIILIGGAMAYTFLKFEGKSVGKSLVEDNEMDVVKAIMEKANAKNVKIYLPIDHVVSDRFGGQPKKCDDINIPEFYMGLDIGDKSIKLYTGILDRCKTVLWNGPMGVFEQDDYAKGTFAIAEKLATLDATVVVGGGDSVSAVKKAGVADKISHISTGGGASLEYIEFGKLPGIEVLR